MALPKEYEQDNPPKPVDQMSWDDAYGDPAHCNKGGGGNIKNQGHPTVEQDGMGGE